MAPFQTAFLEYSLLFKPIGRHKLFQWEAIHKRQLLAEYQRDLILNKLTRAKLCVIFSCVHQQRAPGRLETRFSILEVFENRVSRLAFRVSIFEVREPSFKDRVSSFETLEEFFEDLEQRFRGNDLILENKTIAMNKAIDERLYSRKLTRCCMYANIFSCCAFSTRHMRFAYLH